jgi:pilus assembly protein CpaB
MKWSVLGLLVLGIVAAVCAAVLAASLQARRSGIRAADTALPSETRLVVAARDLDSLAVVDAGSVETRTIASEVAPADGLSDPVQVVGKVLREPLKKGQPFTAASFASGPGVRLAAALRDGQRAVTVSLSDSMGAEPILYPGCLVDVLVSMRVKPEEGQGDAPVSMTLLQGVMVLAVGQRTIVDPGKEPEGGASDRAAGGRPPVTLLVEPDQAEMLKLAMEEGSISLVLRNPLDGERAEERGTRLESLSPILAAFAEAARQRARERGEDRERSIEREKEKHAQELQKLRNEIEIAQDRYEREKAEARQAKDEIVKPPWETVIVRGGSVEVKSFRLPDSPR